MEGRHTNFLIYWMPVWLYCTVIFIQSSYPSMAHLRDVPFGDKYLHFIGYAILGILFSRAFRSSRPRTRMIVLSLLSISASTAYGISDEIHQYFVPSRSADIMDALADMVGSCMGVLAYFMLVDNCHILPKYPWIEKFRQYL
jgi:VanZ family protein